MATRRRSNRNKKKSKRQRGGFSLGSQGLYYGYAGTVDNNSNFSNYPPMSNGKITELHTNPSTGGGASPVTKTLGGGSKNNNNNKTKGKIRRRARRRARRRTRRRMMRGGSMMNWGTEWLGGDISTWGKQGGYYPQISYFDRMAIEDTRSQ